MTAGYRGLEHCQVERCIHGIRMTRPCHLCRTVLAGLSPYTGESARERAARRRALRRLRRTP